MEMSVGVIGLGSMGMGAAVSLVREGIKTSGLDRRPEACAAFTKAGGTIAPDAQTLGATSDVIFVYVVNAEQVREVLFGEGGAALAARPGTVFAICVTMQPSDAIDICDRLTKAGMLAIDSPVSGGAAKAMEGQISMMASGPEAAFQRAAPALAAISATVFRLGEEPGAGARIKVINQMLAGVHIAAMAEAMVLAARQGMDLAEVHRVIQSCAGNSWMFANRGAHVVEGDYTPHSAVDIFVKDMGIVTDTAAASNSPAVLANAALDLFRRASAEGLGGRDDASVALCLARQAGVKLPGDEGADA